MGDTSLYTLITSLMYIFDESKSVSPKSSARTQRWALTLSAYTYCIWYKVGKEYANVDGLSWQPLVKVPAEVPQPQTIFLMDHLAASPVSASYIHSQTDHNPVLSKVRVCDAWLAHTGVHVQEMATVQPTATGAKCQGQVHLMPPAL